MEQKYEALLDDFVRRCERILKDNLVGVYLHGSAAMGCFHQACSDLDLIVVVRETPGDDVKRRFMDMTLRLNHRAPAKGIEMSVVRARVCRPFVYPTPFELHFSIAHLEWYRSKPEEYIEKMKGTDRDLAAHFTVLRARGRALCGQPIDGVFGPVPPEDYFDSIRRDIEDARNGIAQNPVYFILNLCRVLAWKEEGLVLSKAEGGIWTAPRLPLPFQIIVLEAASAYHQGRRACPSPELAEAFAEYMLARIDGREEIINPERP